MVGSFDHEESAFDSGGFESLVEFLGLVAVDGAVGGSMQGEGWGRVLVDVGDR